ncbi:10729_t:CDS:2 [Funneliformis mosseae]|uniref:10729_t:CDS:1 n=1 Tax=Funneliformis mosseae TaxID=27381 RepID=A0A9N9D4T2_FUNMO|nr:10729_t:CDS:2 [Funneliformis mosseae]
MCKPDITMWLAISSLFFKPFAHKPGISSACKTRGDTSASGTVFEMTVYYNPSPFRMIRPSKKSTLESNDVSKSAKETLSSFQENYPPEETIIANTTPSRRDTDN